MTSGDEYRVKAAEFRARASQETRPVLRHSYEAFAQLYLRLAGQADRNGEMDIVYGPILPPRNRGPEVT
jgi:hypothetical protein